MNAPRKKFREHLKWASKVVATWPPWKRNLLASVKPACQRREEVDNARQK